MEALSRNSVGNTYLIPQLAWSDLFCSLYTFVDIILLAFSSPYSSIQYIVNALDPSYFLVAPAAERYYPNLRPFLHLKKANITFEQGYRYGLPIYRYGLLLAFLGSVGMTTHHWTAAIKYSSNNASISSTRNALGVSETINTTLHIRPSCVWSILPNMAVIFCYSRVMIAYGSKWKTKLQTLLSSNHVGNRQIFSSSSLQHS